VSERNRERGGSLGRLAAMGHGGGSGYSVRRGVFRSTEGT
jgi:hypothetical protein